MRCWLKFESNRNGPSVTRQVLTELDRLVEHYEVKSHWNLLTYRECDKCKERYVREPGWEYYRRGFTHFTLRGFVCKQCCLTAGCVATWAQHHEAEARKERLASIPKLVTPPKPVFCPLPVKIST